MYNKVLAKRVRELKETPKGVGEMCKVLEDLYAEIKEEAMAEDLTQGKAEERVSLLRNLIANMKCSAEQAMDMLGIPMDCRDNCLKMLQKQ